ncbi:hypothetical protein CEV08_02245 [Bartonella tribocorum]|uniref:Uncharacterized protein n=1 Tax=Bartonella tribocorum TaxID=85701 RepID=A0A2M6UX71_9HYPH|nr:hypothetical protein CEV08_02245 [Bartonella tribocorum]
MWIKAIAKKNKIPLIHSLIYKGSYMQGITTLGVVNSMKMPDILYMNYKDGSAQCLYTSGSTYILYVQCCEIAFGA